MNFAEPLKIDPNLTLETRVLPSPMAGVMGPVYCRTASNMGLVKNWFMPFISVTKGSVPSCTSLRRKLAPYRNGKPLITQILGHDPATMVATAKRLAECGAASVNINFACPAPMVLKNGNGGAVLADPDLMFQVADAVAKAVGTAANVSVKIRAGAHSADELPVIADVIKSTGIKFVICHFRTVDEMYEKITDSLSRLTKLRELLPPDAVLLGNGDITGPVEAEIMCRETGCDGVTVGRALISDPFVLRKIERGQQTDVSEEEKLDFLRNILCSADELNYRTKRWIRTTFVGFARMSLGEDSPLFRKIAGDPEGFAENGH